MPERCRYLLQNTGDYVRGRIALTVLDLIQKGPFCEVLTEKSGIGPVDCLCPQDTTTTCEHSPDYQPPQPEA